MDRCIIDLTSIVILLLIFSAIMRWLDFTEKIKDDNPSITKCNKSVKYHQSRKGAIIFFLLKSVPFFSEKGVIKIN